MLHTKPVNCNTVNFREGVRRGYTNIWSFDFLFCPLYKERILSIEERDAVVQSVSHDLEITAIFLQTLASSLSWTKQSFNLTAVLLRCFLIQLSCSFFDVSAKNCNSNINLESLFYHLILNFAAVFLTVNNLLWCLLRKHFSSVEFFNVMTLFVS